MTVHQPLGRALPAALAFTSATVDMLCLLSLAHFHSATLTGDLSQGTTSLVDGPSINRLALAAIPVFLCGLLASYMTVRRLSGDPRRVLRILFIAQSMLLTLAAMFAGALPVGPWWTAQGSGLAVGLMPPLLCVLAISLSNTTMTLLDRQAPTTWALTANVVRAAIALLDLATQDGDAAERAQRWAMWTRTWPTLGCFLIGGMAAAVALAHLGPSAWLMPAVLTLAYAWIDWRLP